MTILTPHPEVTRQTRVDDVPDVTQRCLQGILKARNDQTMLFDRQIRDRNWTQTQGTEDITSTCICLIGLHRAAIDPATLGIDISRTLDAVIARAMHDSYAGSIGLVTWAVSLWWPELRGETRNRLLRHRTQYGHYLPVLTTMELAWLVSGLVHASENSVLAGETALLNEARRELHHRVGRHSLMMHSGRGGSVRHRIRRHVANFADQIYSVQALAFLARSRDDRRSREFATACAHRLIDLQGIRGQWWWHYDGVEGTVLRPYPVYSVHQLGMAPMSLHALHAVDSRDEWLEASALSRRWLTDNELGVSMISAETVWRDLRPHESTLSTLVDQTRSVLGKCGTESVDPSHDLEINYETRPYEWAWYLYAEAIRRGEPREGHVV